MKRQGNLYHRVCDFQNLLSASRKARKGKRFTAGCRAFELDLEKNLLTLQKELKEGSFRPGPYRRFRIFEPKERVISAAPYRDRVVHHALVNVIEPIFDRGMIADSYANRVGKGTHKAVNRFTAFARKNRYVLKMDVVRFFPRIDHRILTEMIERKIKDPEILGLVKVILDSGKEPPDERDLEYFKGDDLFTPLERPRGLPIGNLTSQFFANIYLNGFDHFMKEAIRCRHYLRYMDDLAIFGDDKGFLRDAREASVCQLETLRLRVHRNRAQYWPVAGGTDWLRYRIYPDYRRIRKSNLRKFRKKLQSLSILYRDGMADLRQVTASVRSWVGHSKHADTYRIREEILGNAVFRRGQG